MIPLKKIEIVIESIQMKRVYGLLERIGVPGYTVIEDVIGRGKSGYHDWGELSEVSKNSYILVFSDNDQAEQIIEGMKPLHRKFGGISVVSDVYQITSKDK